MSTLNSFDGRVVANAAVVPAEGGGAVSVYVSDATDVIIDINGYFAPPDTAALAFYPVAPCRVADTRSGSGKTGQLGPPALGGGKSRTIPMQASGCSLPAAVQAFSLNVTVVPPGPLIYLTTWPAAQTNPVASTLNSFDGDVVANAAIVPAGAGGDISVFVYLTTWPTGQPQPFVSTLNSFLGKVLANAALVPAGDNGKSACSCTTRRT